MKITCNTEKTISKEHAIRIKQLVDGCAALRDQVTEIIFKHGYERYVEDVYLRQIAGVPAVRIQLVFGEYNSVIYLQQEKQGVGKIEVHPPKFNPTKQLTQVGNYAEWMSWLATISGTIYREVVWNIDFRDDVISSTKSANKRVVAMETFQAKGYYRLHEYENHNGQYQVGKALHTWGDIDKAVKWVEDNGDDDKEYCLMSITPDGKGGYTNRAVWTSVGGVLASSDIEANGGKQLTGDVTVKELADLFRSAWETANLSWGNTAEDLLEWQDAFYCDTKYREGVADYAIANIPQLQEANMSDVHVIADEDENSSELLLTICIDSKPVDKIRTWYVHDRWDAFLDEL